MFHKTQTVEIFLTLTQSRKHTSQMRCTFFSSFVMCVCVCVCQNINVSAVYRRAGINMSKMCVKKTHIQTRKCTHTKQQETNGCYYYCTVRSGS